MAKKLDVVPMSIVWTDLMRAVNALSGETYKNFQYVADVARGLRFNATIKKVLPGAKKAVLAEYKKNNQKPRHPI